MIGMGNPHSRLVLVTGATGRQGGAVARQLLREAFRVRVMTRNTGSQAAQILAAMGAEIVQGDFDDARSLRNALAHVSGVFAMQTPYESGTEREIVHGVRLADIAREAGVTQFVYSSVAAADLPTGVPHFESKGKIERHIAALGFHSTTILRPVFFMEMLLSKGNLRSLAEGRVEMALKPSTAVAMVAVDDIAAMTKFTFLNPRKWHGQAITLTGDTPNFDEVAAAFGNALSAKINYVQVSPERLDPDIRPKIATQQWLENEGWEVDLASLSNTYPFTPKTISQWAIENTEALRYS
jgi:uncharacterized protein YbjT (DUF2867 family)